MSLNKLWVRWLFIRTVDTPNPQWLKFYPGKTVLEDKVSTLDFPSVRNTHISPLARRLFLIDGIVRVFYANDYLAITKKDTEEWEFLTPEIYSAITEHYMKGQPLLVDEPPEEDTVIKDTDSTVVAAIKEIVITRVRPFVQKDGGDVSYKNFDTETGKVTLLMKGSWAGWPSSQVTLKHAIERMLKHYVEEVKSVEGVDAV